MSEDYINKHFADIKKFANVIEKRKCDDSDFSIDAVLKDNKFNLEMCKKFELDYAVIDGEYEIDFEL